MSVNVSQAFPLKHLASDIARANYNYESVFNGLMEWANSRSSTVTIRLTRDGDPWVNEYTIPTLSKISASSVASASAGVYPGAIDLNGEYAYACSLGTPSVQSGTMTFSAGSASVSYTGTLSSGIRFRLLGDTSYRDYDVVSVDSSAMTAVIADWSGTSVTDVPAGTYTYHAMPSEPEYLSGNYPDSVRVRVTVGGLGGTRWKLYGHVSVNSFSEDASYVPGQIVRTWDGAEVLWRVMDSTVAGETPSTDGFPFRKLVRIWESGMRVIAGDFIVSGSTVYLATVDSASSDIDPVSGSSSDFISLCPVWSSSVSYPRGTMVYRNGSFFVRRGYSSGTYTDPANYADTYDGASWSETALSPVDWSEYLAVPVSGASAYYGSSVTERFYPDYDFSGFALRNVGSSESGADAAITLSASSAVRGPDSVYERSVGVFDTCNYAMWPYSDASKWSSAMTYGPTDASIGIENRQSYSAVMVFDHTLPGKAKSVNFVNYDGPDLDQGLCVYLPVSVTVSDGTFSVPEDGYTFDFMFRIWPDPSLNGEVTDDGIINKAQIYVYSSPDSDSISSDSCGRPIAKFSMARLTNFYMFGENVAVPDRPVCVRARFIYSASEGTWKTLDYYQLPDHLFVGPVGFIDPLGSDTAVWNGMETAGFPLFQDPFSSTDLSPYRFGSSGDASAFSNRII